MVVILRIFPFHLFHPIPVIIPTTRASTTPAIAINNIRNTLSCKTVNRLSFEITKKKFLKFHSLNFLYNRFARNWKTRMKTHSIATSASGLKIVWP